MLSIIGSSASSLQPVSQINNSSPLELNFIKRVRKVVLKAIEDGRLGNMGSFTSPPNTLDSNQGLTDECLVKNLKNIASKYNDFYSLKKGIKAVGNTVNKKTPDGRIIKVNQYQKYLNCSNYISGSSHNCYIHKDKKQNPFFSNIQTCHSPECPVCGPKIASARADEVTKAIELCYANKGHHVAMITKTIPHYFGQSCSTVMNNLLKVNNKFSSGKVYKKIKDRFGIYGTITAKETTYSESNGWHHHLHQLYFFNRSLTDDEKREFEFKITDRWVKSVLNSSLECKSHDDLYKRGIDVIWDVSSSQYIAKQSMASDYTSGDLEITLANNKRSLKNVHPIQLIQMYSKTNDLKYIYRYLEYIDSMSVTKRIAFSPGLKRDLKMNIKTDEEIVQACSDNTDEYSIELMFQHLNYIVENKLHSQMLSKASVNFDLVIDDFVKAGIDPPKVVLTDSIFNSSKERNIKDVEDFRQLVADKINTRFDDQMDYFQKRYSYIA